MSSPFAKCQGEGFFLNFVSHMHKKEDVSLNIEDLMIKVTKAKNIDLTGNIAKTLRYNYALQSLDALKYTGHEPELKEELKGALEEYLKKYR